MMTQILGRFAVIRRIRLTSFGLFSQFICGFKLAHFLGKSTEGASVESKRAYFHNYSTLNVE
jgi:hypothetical protein